MERRRMTLLASLPVRKERRATAARSRANDRAFTPRQLEVLDALRLGLANKEIASRLGVGPDAVKRIVSRLLDKVEVPSRAALVEYALRTAAVRVERDGAPKEFSLLDEVPIPALVTRGADHTIHFANEEWRALGLPVETGGHRLIDVVPADLGRALSALADETFRTGRERRAPRLGLPKTSRDGGQHGPPHAEVVVRALRDGAGDVAGVLLFVVWDGAQPATKAEGAARVS